jgi:hypothetical protein
VAEPTVEPRWVTPWPETGATMRLDNASAYPSGGPVGSCRRADGTGTAAGIGPSQPEATAGSLGLAKNGALALTATLPTLTPHDIVSPFPAWPTRPIGVDFDPWDGLKG